MKTIKISRREFKEKVIRLREQGKTYLEIRKALKQNIPKSTLSYWCRNISLPGNYKRKIEEYNKFNLIKARKIALVVNRNKRKKYLESLADRNKHLATKMGNKDIAKIAIALLYLAEGKKQKNAALVLGNSDPSIIDLFLSLLRYCYKIDEQKFRCTLQCRVDQNIKKLEKFWSRITRIPLSQFYKARIDPRTIGKPSKKLDYKGVCRIDYFSGELFNEIIQIPRIIAAGPWRSG